MQVVFNCCGSVWPFAAQRLEGCKFVEALSGSPDATFVAPMVFYADLLTDNVRFLTNRKFSALETLSPPNYSIFGGESDLNCKIPQNVQNLGCFLKNSMDFIQKHT